VKSSCRAALLGVFVTCCAFGILANGQGVGAGSFAVNCAGARAVGLGGAFVALADDAYAGLWNPAGACAPDDLRIGGMVVVDADIGRSLQSIAAGLGLGRLGISAGLLRSSIKGIPFRGSEGTGGFADTQNQFSLSTAYSFMQSDLGEGSPLHLSAGAGVKLHTHKILDASAWGVGFDVGLLGRMEFDWGDASVGLSSRDILETSVQWQGTETNPVDVVPWTSQFGLCVSLQTPSVRLAADVELDHSGIGSARFRGGAEITVVPPLTLRAGIQLTSADPNQISVGATVRWRTYLLHLAYVHRSQISGSYILTLEAQFPQTQDDRNDRDS